jgi:hypothetical protein
LAPGLVAGSTVRTRIVRNAEGSDDELARFHGLDRGTDLLDNSAILVAHRRGLGRALDTSIRPQIGTAHACCGKSDDGVGGIENLGIGSLFEADIPWSV